MHSFALLRELKGLLLFAGLSVMKPMSFLLIPLICPEELRLGFFACFFSCIFGLGHCLAEENFFAAIVNYQKKKKKRQAKI